MKSTLCNLLFSYLPDIFEQGSVSGESNDLPEQSKDLHSPLKQNWLVNCDSLDPQGDPSGTFHPWVINPPPRLWHQT